MKQTVTIEWLIDEPDYDIFAGMEDSVDIDVSRVNDTVDLLQLIETTVSDKYGIDVYSTHTSDCADFKILNFSVLSKAID